VFSVYVKEGHQRNKEEEDFLLAIANGLAGIIERKKAEEKFQWSFEKLKRVLGQTVNALASALEKRDPYTAGHQQRVSQLARAIGQEMNLSQEQNEGIRIAGILHDIGKIYVPAEILSKPGKLTKTEFELIKTHSQVGYEILQGIEFAWPVARTVLQHHERLDGSGYPKGISGKEISIEAKILGVADVIEAMSSHRPFRPSLGLDITLEEISKNRGVLYDTDVADAALKLFTKKGFKFE
jgi:putative nucleotidyltransferase with HDIG domain